MKSTYLNLVFVILLPFSVGVMAEDFALKSDNELFSMRDQVRTMDTATKDAYRSERQGRMMQMDSSARDAMFADMGASGKRNMDNMSHNKGSRRRDGSGGGKQKGKGRGGQSGDASQYRSGQDFSQEYGNSSGSHFGGGAGNGRGRGGQY